MENNDKKKRSFWEIIMYVYIIGVFVTVVLGPVPHYRKCGYRVSRSRDRVCYSNIRIIQGAIEMYNSDHETMISSLSDSETQNPTNLKGYLKPVSHPETQCCYQGSGLGDGEGGIWCTYHGDVDGSLGINGVYQKPPEVSKLNIFVNNFMKECQYQFPYALVWPILWPYVIFFSR